jgi:hypothetical protein
VPWYSVRCLFEISSRTYEERICLWQARSLDHAVSLSEREAREYASNLELKYLGLAQAYEMPEPPGHGLEAFSLIRESELPPSEYLDKFFDTGTEYQQTE